MGQSISEDFEHYPVCGISYLLALALWCFTLCCPDQAAYALGVLLDGARPALHRKKSREMLLHTPHNHNQPIYPNIFDYRIDLLFPVLDLV